MGIVLRMRIGQIAYGLEARKTMHDVLEFKSISEVQNFAEPPCTWARQFEAATLNVGDHVDFNQRVAGNSSSRRHRGAHGRDRSPVRA